VIVIYVVTALAGADAKYCDEYVCVYVCACVCLFVREDTIGTTRAIFTIFVHVAYMAVARSSSGVVAICYVFPVLWITSCFSSTMGHIAV